MIAFEVEQGKPAGDTFLDWLEERDELMAACAARESGHRWQVEAEPGEEPCLSCQDCPAGGDDLYPDIHIYLACDEEPDTIGDHKVLWGRPLPDDAEPFTIPVDVRIESHRYTSMDCIGYEYDVEIHVALRGGDVA